MSEKLYDSVNHFYMRKFILIIIIFCWIGNSLFSQSRFPISATSVWRIDHIRNGVSDETKHEQGDEIFKYFIDGDTIIQTKTYFKVYKTGTLYLDEPVSYEHQYAFALRDENNRFYMVKKNQVQEVLLYNFDATVDDTIQVSYYGEFEEKVVSSVDSLPDGRRIIHCNPRIPIIGCGDQYIIEGIGGSGGLPEGPACNHAWTGDNHLVCYMQDDMLMYHDNNFNFNCEISNVNGDNAVVDSTCVWRVDKQSESDKGSEYEKLNYFFSGDTIIASVSYLKLFKAGYKLTVYSNESYTSHYYGPSYAGAMRVDAKNLFFIPKDIGTEELLFNFGMQEGDNVDGIIYNGQKVLSVDTILENRKVFYLSNNIWEKMIIEGIGSEKGLLENAGENSWLVCFMKNNATIYHMETGSECLLTPDKRDFLDCSYVTLQPEQPDEEDEVKAVIHLCSEVSYHHPVLPEYKGSEMLVGGNTIQLGLFYDYDDEGNSDTLYTVKPQSDTVSLGYLKSDWYTLEVYIHAIRHNNDVTDTVLYKKTLFQHFSVSTANGNHDPVSENGFEINPVPAKDRLTIEIPEMQKKPCIIQVYSVTGSLVTTTIARSSKTDLYLQAMKNGIYFISVSNDEIHLTKKFVVDK